LFAAEEAELWAVTVRGRVVGLLTREAGRSRLSWFDAADPRLTGYAGPADGEPESLAEALSNRLGLPVELSPLPV
jgi:hypothetical protein